ncbi:elastin-like [Schistocerca nitens]|uniref:elastin-like n=1 Tax=Schistocerca nitens TaxID=7011 RepID=UPI002117D4E7|nr:elastin-like [Schistocerca nitens]
MAAEWAPDKALRCQTPWGCPRKAAAVQAAQPPLGKAARLRGRRPSAPKAVVTEEGPQAPERPPGALPYEAAREASTGRVVGVVAATAAAAVLGAVAKSEGAAGTRRGPNLWTKNERQNPGGQHGATGSDASCAPQFGPLRVPAAPSDFAAAPRAAAAAVAATTLTAHPVDDSRAASSGSAPGGRSGACGPSSVATAFGADGCRPLSRAAFPSGGCAACPAAAFLGHPQGV